MLDAHRHVGDLIGGARAAVAGGRWLETLDLASQALAADHKHEEAAALIGMSRRRLGAVSSAGAQLRHITVISVDMCRSTTIAATIGPERMRELMLELYELCAEAVSRYEGRVSKYAGDGVLAQFGYPVAHEDDARRAVLAADTILELVEESDWAERYGFEIRVRIGLDSGVAAVGPVDASPWSPEEIAGDPPNIATRVQATADPMTIRITDATNELIRGWFETAPLGMAELRNYPRAVALHRVVKSTGAETRLEASIRPRPALVGRDDELSILRECWTRVAQDGDRQVVAITGPAGIGKSRLVEHMLATAVATGATHLTLTCTALFKDSPLRPVARAVARCFRVFPREGGSDGLWLDAIRLRLEQLSARRVATDDAVPLLGRLLGIARAVDLQPNELRMGTFDVLIDLFEAMATDSHLVVCVEDAEEADPSTMELLKALIARPAVPMLLIVASREPLPWIGETDRQIELDALAPEDSATLVRSVARGLDDTVVESLAAQSQGVPFFAEELALAAVDGPPRSGSPGTVALSSFLAARLDELGPELKRLVELIAVAGHEIRVDVLGRIAGVDEDAIDSGIAELERRRVVERGITGSTDIVRLRHGLLQTVAYEGLLEAQRCELHGALANALAELPGSVAEDLAGHFELAGNPVDAVPRWLTVAREAGATGAGDETLELYRRALTALEQLPSGSTRSQLALEAHLGLGATLSLMEGYTSRAARASFEEAMSIGEELGDSTALLPALWGTWAYWLVLGEHSAASALADRCVRIAAQAPAEPELQLVATAIRGYQLLYLGDFTGAAEDLIATAHGSGSDETGVFPHDPRIVAVASLAVVQWFLGRYEDSRATNREALAITGAMDPANRRTPVTQCFAGCLLAWRAELDGDPRSALRHADRVLEIALARGYPNWIEAATLHRSIALCSLSRFDQGLPTLEAVVGAWRAAGQDSDGRQLHPMLMTPYFAGRLAEAHLRTGDTTAALAELNLTLAQTAANHENFWDPELLRLRATAAHASGLSPDAVARDLEAAHRLAQARDAGGLLARLDRAQEALL